MNMVHYDCGANLVILFTSKLKIFGDKYLRALVIQSIYVTTSYKYSFKGFHRTK